MKKLFFFYLLFIICGCAFSQITPPNQIVPIVDILYQTITPEGILGERKVSATFQRWDGRFSVEVSLKSAHLYYSTSATGALAENLTPAQAQSRNEIGITPATQVNGRWQIILPHSGINNGSLGTNFEYKGRDKVYYKWCLTLQDNSTNFSNVASFILPRPLNIAIMGDSYASGEGAPMPRVLWVPGGENAHRSENSGQFTGVKLFAATNPNIAIVYKPFFVSSSGGTTSNLFRVPQIPTYCDKINDIPTIPQLRQIQNIFRNPSLFPFKEDIQGKIDAAIISTGGNDAGFGDAVTSAFFNRLAPNIDDYTRRVNNDVPVNYDELRRFLEDQCINYVYSTEYPNPTLNEKGVTCGLPQNIIMFLVMAHLESEYHQHLNVGQFGCEVGEGIVDFFFGNNGTNDCEASEIFATPNYDYLMEYIRCNIAAGGTNELAALEVLANGFIDFLRAIQSSNGVYSTFENLMALCIPADGIPSNSNVFTTLGATMEDIAAARDGFLIPLNKVIEQKVTQFNNSGFQHWYYVKGAMELSRAHGVCNCDPQSRYFNSLVASFDQQGTKEGTMHLNQAGQQAVYQPLIFDILQRTITTEARRGMLLNNCEKMKPALPGQLPRNLSITPQYANLLAKAMELKSSMLIVNQDKFRKLFELLRPQLPSLIKNIDPKLFAKQFMAREFGKLREIRLKK